MSSINPSRLLVQLQSPPPDDFLDQMLVNLPSWPDSDLNKASSWDLNPQNPNSTNYDDESSALLATRLQQQHLLDPAFLSSHNNGGNSVSGLYNNGYSGSVPQPGQIANQHFNHSQVNLNYGAATTGINQAPASANPPVRQRVRARRGQATDPHSIAERLRRERIAERMKGLQELVPNANKTDKASMLDEIIDYVKFLQLQVKVLSMSRLGGAAAVAPLLADMSTEGGAESIQTSGNGNGTQAASTASDSLAVTENQVVKLMEEDMGSAMQYLQGKGLCLMPISLASAISAATSSQARNLNSTIFLGSNLDGPTSPNLSVLSAQSTMGNGISETSVRDVTSVSKP